MSRRLQLTRERAFTLIELLVVILIIGILIAVAAPSFLGQTSKAQNSVAQQQLTTSLTEAKLAWTASQTGFPTEALLVAQLQASEPQYSYAVGPGTATTTTTDVTNATGGNTVTFCLQSGSGLFFCAADDEAGLTTFAAYHQPASLLDRLFGVGTAYAASLAEIGYSTGPTEADARAVLSNPNDPSTWGEGKAGWGVPASPSANTPICPDSNQNVAAFSDTANYCVGDEVTAGGHVWKALATVYPGGADPTAAPATLNVPLGDYDAGTVNRSAQIVGDGTYSGTMSQSPANQPIELAGTYAADWYLISGPVGTAVTLTTSIPVSMTDWGSGGNGYVFNDIANSSGLTSDSEQVTFHIGLPASGSGQNGEDLIEIWPDSGNSVSNPTPASYKLTVSGQGITSGSQWEMVTTPTCPDNLATAAWVSTESYCTGDKVTTGGHTYKAVRAVNAGVDPTAAPATKTVPLGDPTSGVHVSASDVGAGVFTGNETSASFWLSGGEQYGSADYYLFNGPPGTHVTVKTDVPVDLGLWCCATPNGPDSFIQSNDFTYQAPSGDNADPTVTTEAHFVISASGYEILDVGAGGDVVQSPSVAYTLFVTADGLTSGSPWILTGSGGGSGGTGGTGGSGGTGGTGGSGGTGGTGGSGGTGGTGGSGGSGGTGGTGGSGGSGGSNVITDTAGNTCGGGTGATDYYAEPPSPPFGTASAWFSSFGDNYLTVPLSLELVCASPTYPMCVSAGSGLDPESDALDVVDAYVGAFGNSCATWTAAGGAEITQNVLLVVDYSNTYWPSLYYPNKYKGYYFNGFLALFGPPADTGPPGGFTGCNASFGDPSAVPGLSGAEAFPLSNTSNDPYLRTECDDGSLAAYGIPYTSASAPVNTQTPPTISGTTTQGDVLTAATGSWTNAPSSYSYQWQDCTLTNGNLPATGCTNVASGGTSSTYTLAAGDVGHYVVVNVTAINGGGASSPIPSFAAGSPTIIAS